MAAPLILLDDSSSLQRFSSQALPSKSLLLLIHSFSNSLPWLPVYTRGTLTLHPMLLCISCFLGLRGLGLRFQWRLCRRTKGSNSSSGRKILVLRPFSSSDFSHLQNRPKFGFSPWYPMYTSQLRSLELAAGETEPLANEIRGTGNEKEIRGSVSGPATVTILSIGSSAKSHLSGGGVLYEVLGTSSDWDPQYDTGGEGAGFSGKVALGEMYGDCNAETNAEDGGDGRQESGGEEETILMVRDLGSTAGICLASSAMN
nr:hypothetical protein Iba_chr11fCG0580 [Ipomoea batatas]